MSKPDASNYAAFRFTSGYIFLTLRINLVKLACLRNRLDVKIGRIPGGKTYFSQSSTSQNSSQCPDGSFLVLRREGKRGKRRGSPLSTQYEILVYRGYMKADFESDRNKSLHESPKALLVTP
jgi:hypothetical protein